MGIEKKKPIGILDGGYEGINIFNSLVNEYPNEQFIYVNDPSNYPYEGQEEEKILEHVKRSVRILVKYNVCLILIVNNSIIEYCSEYLNSLLIPTLKISDVIIDYVNENYEHKNICLMAKQYTIKSYMYQKNFKYSHMNTIQSDKLEKIIFDKKVKTSDSFHITRELIIPMRTKDVDVMVIVDSFLMNLNLEIGEYITCNIIVDPSTIVKEDIKKYIDFSQKTRKRSIIISSLSRNEFKNQVYWLNCKYKYISAPYGQSRKISANY